MNLLDDPTVEGIVVTASRRHRAGVRRARPQRGPLPAHRHAGLHGRRDPGRRHRRQDHRLQPALRRDLAPPRRHRGPPGRRRPRSAFALDQLAQPEDFVARLQELDAEPRERDLRHCSSSRTAASSSASTRSQRVGRRGRRARLQLPRRDRSQAARGRAGLPGLPRLVDQAGQQGALPGPPGARPDPHGARRLPPGRALPRPRRLQDGERQPRPRRGGPAAAAGRHDPASTCCGRPTPPPVSAATSSPC